jgi:nucleotide-binding universal stress UspA family protein
MKKFLAAFDGFRMSKSTMAYGQELAYETDAHLVGVFLDEFIYHSYDAYKIITTSKDPEAAMKELNEKDKKKRDEAVKLFQKTSTKANISYSVHRNKSIALQELKHESMFADLIIISKHETFTRYKEKAPTRFIKELLADVQCPVLVVPAAYKPIDKIILLYDGGPSSLHAIKMFSYLFGNMENLPVEVLTVQEGMKGSHLPDNKLMREFIKRHFPQAKAIVKKGNAEEQIQGYLRNHKENELVVLGAYRRSELSRWFKTSMADILMKESDTPLFIAHNK